MALMFDLIALAFRADITRVASMMMAAEASTMTYDHLGVPDSFHLLSHHQNDPEKIDKLVRIQAFHTQHVRDVHSNACGVARRRRLDPRSLARPVRQQHEQQPRARSLPAAAGGGRRRLRPAPRRPASALPRSHADRRTCCSRCFIAPRCPCSPSATAPASARSFEGEILRIKLRQPAGYDIQTLQQLLGHSDVTTTMIYMHGRCG